MTTQSPVVETRGIYMAFGGVDVLKNIDFQLYPGEILALMGENGAGKSTLAKIVAGVHQPRAGTIAVQATTTKISNPLNRRIFSQCIFNFIIISGNKIYQSK